jgi:internalin A
MEFTMHQLGTRMLIAAFLGVFSLAPPALAEGELFPDKNLESAVRKYVFAKRDNDQPLTPDDVKDISTIVARGSEGKRIKDLTGLERCRSLALLDLTSHEIADLTPIKELKKLQFIDLSGNKVKDLAPLEGLTGLQYLKLSDNAVEDVTALAKLSNLRTLFLSKNKVTEIEALGELKKLWSLYLDANAISSLKPIGGLKSLSSLDLRSTGTSDLSALAPLTELRTLRLEGNKLQDLGVLVNMARQDLEKDKRFAPYLRLYLAGNPLGKEAEKQAAELKTMGVRVHLEDVEGVKPAPAAAAGASSGAEKK